jgi:uncharacterized lipoprotein YddW (UPF0748 family)
MNQLAELGFNRLYPVVWSGDFASYPSRVSEGRQLQDFTYRGLQGQDILAELISAGRSRGLKVIPCLNSASWRHRSRRGHGGTAAS